jgi:hypothetical protein
LKISREPGMTVNNAGILLRHAVTEILLFSPCLRRDMAKSGAAPI